MMRAHMTVLAASLAAFVHANAPEPVSRLSPPPVAMRNMVKVICDGAWRGWATPYAATFALSVAHVVENCSTIGWEGGIGKRGNFTVLRIESKVDAEGTPLKDSALLISDAAFDSWATIARRKPEPGELFWHRLLLAGRRSVDAPSWFLGRDEAGHMELEGTSYPGSSGSGLFNVDGELVGVVNGSYGVGMGRSLVWATPNSEVFH
jgi:hypothetical protein